MVTGAIALCNIDDPEAQRGEEITFVELRGPRPLILPFLYHFLVSFRKQELFSLDFESAYQNKLHLVLVPTTRWCLQPMFSTHNCYLGYADIVFWVAFSL